MGGGRTHGCYLYFQLPHHPQQMVQPFRFCAYADDDHNDPLYVWGVEFWKKAGNLRIGIIVFELEVLRKAFLTLF